MVQAQTCLWPSREKLTYRTCTKRMNTDGSPDLGKDDSTCTKTEDRTPQRHSGPRIISDLAEVINGLAPRVDGDLSAGHIAIVGSLSSHVDEILLAENSFLRCDDPEKISSRILAMAKSHISKYFAEGKVPTVGKTGDLQIVSRVV